MRLTTASPAPAFKTEDFLGHPIDLSHLRGRRVLLSFYRYASCPICNLRIRELMLDYAELTKSGLEIIAVFQSPAHAIGQYLTRHDLPFPVVPDPGLRLYKSFGVESRWRGFFSLRVIRSAFAAMGLGFLPGRIDGPVHRVPADFLIDTEGVIALAHYGNTIDDHLPLEQIKAWLQLEQEAERAGMI